MFRHSHCRARGRFLSAGRARGRFPSAAATPLLAAAATMLLLATAGPSVAESAMVLPRPTTFGEVKAGTFDKAGKRLGDAHFMTEELEDGRIRIEASSAIEGSASTRYAVEFERVGDGEAVRPLRQESRSVDEVGRPLGVLIVDHENRVATCEPPAWSGKTEIAKKPLPAGDRVVNIPLNLLFKPLVAGEVEEIEFQVMLCRPDPRLIDAVGRVVEAKDPLATGVVEVQYTVDLGLGGMLSKLAAPFIPTLSVWFDPALPDAWIGHRVPLYAKGPTVTIVRAGVEPSRVGAHP